MKLIVVGAGGYFKSFLDSIHPTQFDIIGLIDDRYPEMQKWFGYDILGAVEDIESIVKKTGVKNFFVTIGEPSKRREVYQNLARYDLNIPTIIDKTANVSRTAVIGKGTFIGKMAMINNDVAIGEYCIVNSGSIIEHGSRIGNNCNISPGAIINGQVTVGNNTAIGAGSVIIQTLNIGTGCVIGAGSVVIRDIESDVTVVGNPARVIKINK